MVVLDIYIAYIVDWDRFIQVLYLGRAPRTKETLPDFLKWRRVTRPPLVFCGLTDSQRTPGFWGVTSHTKPFLTLNGFQKNEDGGAPSECDNKYHSDDTPVVALSTGWYNKGSRCLNNITITANGRSVVAMVVDECDSTMGCDSDHDFQPPCDNNIVDASKAVWEALGVPHDQWGGLDITWTDA